MGMLRLCSIPAHSGWPSVAVAICSGAVALGCLIPASAQAPISYYGAIAVSPFSSSDPDIHWGAASWLTSQFDANQAALKQCRDSGGHVCKIEAQGTGTHLALWFSTPDKAWGVERGASPELVTGMVLAACLRKVANLTHCTLPTDGTSSSEPGRAGSIDPRVVGSWKIPVGLGHWFLEVDPLGTYKFHSDAGDGAPTTSGSFATNAGYWSLQATNGYADAGPYYIQPPDTFVATSQGLIGEGSWRHPIGAAPPLDENGQRLYVRLVTGPPNADMWSLAGTALIKATASISPPIGQAVVTYELQPLAAGLPASVIFRIFPTSEAAAAYVDDKQLLANYVTDLPAPGVINLGGIAPIEPFDHSPRFASTMQSKEQRGWLRWAYQEGRVVILVTTGEAKPNVKDNDSISDNLFKKGLQLLQLGELWLKEKSRQ
jgi:hypothetical protein